MTDYIFSYDFLVQAVFSIVAVFISLSLGKVMNKYVSEYQPIASLFEAENNTGFNAIYRILFAPVGVVFISIVLYLLGNADLLSHVWLISLYFAVGQFFVLFILGRWTLVNKWKFLLFHVISILLSYYLYKEAISKGVSHLLPDEANLRSDIWLVIIAFLYGIFKNIPENYIYFSSRKTRYILKKARYFKMKYRFTLDKYENGMADVLVSIMIYENYNRPFVTRLLEKITFSETQHIMQVFGVKNDNESIVAAADNLKEAYGNYISTDFEEEWGKENALDELFSLHNPNDPNYGIRVGEIYRTISK